MKPPRRIPDLADKPELHERERKRRLWRNAPSGTKTHRYREFKRSTTEALRAGA